MKNPSAFRWPLVVDWDAGTAAVGDVEGVSKMLEHMAQKRDGKVCEKEELRRKDEAAKGWVSRS
ncbi:hypothetical protein BDV98DRAFT_576556 [Pterulicium gracile]|uniref:Uncharacterized protein n=1 Tax=Pterulicium gracile TaxID=1884261 RepID=A0A5C3Q266_9AGAR|nr:hypothetical protein BDV98DRAFT_576556 [Pterula gracilis]